LPTKTAHDGLGGFLSTLTNNTIMKKTVLFLIVLVLGFNSLYSQVAINTSGNAPDASAMLDITSTEGGILIPRMAEANRQSINNPANGLLVYQTDNTIGFYFFDGTIWVQLSAGNSTVSKLDDLNDAKSDNDGTSDGSSIFIGVDAGAVDDGTDNNNVGVGLKSLMANTTGAFNTAFGHESQYFNISGIQNTASGTYSLYGNTEGSRNTAIGYQAIDANRAGSNATAIGHNSMQYSNSSTTAFINSNVAVGFEAMRGSTTASNNIGNNNTALGYQSLLSNAAGDYNTAIGKHSLYKNTDGDFNVAVGNTALYNNTTGGSNLASGYNSLYNNITGYTNVAVGTNALFSNIAGSKATAVGFNAMQYANNTTTAFNNENVALGYEALRGSSNATNNTGNSNTAVGYESLWSITSGSNNTASGNKSLYSNTEGVSNSAMGQGAMFSNTTGNENTSLGVGSYYTNQAGSQGTAIGCRAMQFTYNSSTAFINKNVALGYEALRGGWLNADANTGNSNTAIGFQSLWANTTGDENTSNGYQALYLNAEGNYNTAIGKTALYNNDEGDYNTAVGMSALGHSESRDYNTAIGYQAGDRSDGDGNVFIGANAGYHSLASDRLYIDNTSTIDPLIYGEFDEDRLKVNGSLEVTSQIKVSASSDTPEAGMIRWNSTKQDFEGYTGNLWRSLTKQNSVYGEIAYSIDINETQSKTSSDGMEDDYFGYSVATDGYYTIIGAYGVDTAGFDEQGAAYIFYKDGNDWVQQATLVADDGYDEDYFGWSVDISGGYAIIGAKLANSATSTNCGAAYIFTKRFGAWTQQARLEGDDDYNSQFGYSVSIDGDNAVVGEIYYDTPLLSNKGRVYIFTRSISTWSQLQELEASDGTGDDRFGSSVSIDGDYLIVGAKGENIVDLISLDAGAAYIFKYDGSSWIQQDKITASVRKEDAEFGTCVSISGNYVIIGAPLENIGTTVDQGAAYIFERNGTNWYQQEILTDTDGSYNDEFGISVSIDGDFAIVGSHQDDVGSNGRQGSAFIYQKNERNSWNQFAHLFQKSGREEDYFGKSVSISANTAVVGAPERNGASGHGDQGFVCFFDR